MNGLKENGATKLDLSDLRDGIRADLKADRRWVIGTILAAAVLFVSAVVALDRLGFLTASRATVDEEKKSTAVNERQQTTLFTELGGGVGLGGPANGAPRRNAGLPSRR